MHYKEFQPSAYFSQHIESFWEMQLVPGELDSPFELLSPDCTFDVLFTDEPFLINFYADSSSKKVFRGATFVGQKTNSVRFAIRKPATIFGIRFKPFAFANLIDIPLYHLNDQACRLEKLFDLKSNDYQFIQEIINQDLTQDKMELAETLVLNLLKKSFSIDQIFREQLNYIMDRKGLIKINHLLKEFGTSKVTLRKHFIEKLGLTPKKVSRIWRINYFLELQNKNVDFNLTQLCLEAGFYDQAHFIKEFKDFFRVCPRHFFQQESQLIKISQHSISKRFSNQYNPR